MGRGGQVSLKADSIVTLGRSPDCAVCVNQKHVSWEHCEIRVDSQDRCFIRDLGSSNGTLVNGSKLYLGEQRELSNGDLVDLQESLAFLVLCFPLENVSRYTESVRS